MRVRIDIGIDPQRNRRAQLLRAGDFVDVFQLGFALDVKAINALVNRILDFVARFADTGEGAFCGIGPGFDCAEKFAAGNNIESCAGFREQFQNCTIRIRFDRVADEMIERRERGVEAIEVIENRARAINIERRAEALRRPRKIDIFAVELPVAIPKRMHDQL